MSEHNLDRVREMQKQIEFDAQGALSRAELQRLRAYWGDLQQILDSETATG